MRIKPPRKICRNKIHQILGIISPGLMIYYIEKGDKEVCKYAKKTHFFDWKF